LSENISSKRLTEELERYRGKSPELEELVGFYKEVFKIQESTRSKIGSAPEVVIEAALGRLEAGHFILEGKGPTINYGVFKETAKALSEAFSKATGKKFPIAELLALPQLKPEKIYTFSADILNNRIDYLKDFSKGTEFNKETIFHFLHNLVIPFFQAEAERYGDLFGKAEWLKGICPFCGSPPRYARFHKEDGRRLLSCPLCRSQWRFHRICCPFCSNSNQKKLKHCQLGKDEGHRVDVCDVCKRYIKTTNERQMDREVIPQVEDVVTIALDYLATQEGYHRDA
jgi:FdhE protein